MVRGSVGTARTQRGAAAVEAAMMAMLVLVPLLSGLLYWGNYFWQAQKVDNLNATGIPPGSVSGTYSCSELVDRVKTLLDANVTSLAASLGVPKSAIKVTSKVVNVLPTIGADVEVSLSVPVANQLASALPLPNGGAVVTSATQRLSNVKVTTSSC